MEKSLKSKKITLILSFLIVGGHNFYVGRWGKGLLQIFTVGGFFIWQIMDIIKIANNQYEDSEGNLIS